MHVGRPAALLAYLALQDGRDVPRDVVVDALWPEIDPCAGRNRLKQTLFMLRGYLDKAAAGLGALVVADRDHLFIPGDRAVTDVADFRSTIQSGYREGVPKDRLQGVEAAFELYRGALLPGFYDDWVLAERTSMAALASRASIELATIREAAGDLDGAVQLARRGAGIDPLNEHAHCELIRLYARMGRRVDAIRQYRHLEDVLADELQTEPSSSSQALLAWIDKPEMDSAAPKPHSKGPRSPAPALEPAGGAVPLDSRYYIVREADIKFEAAVSRLDSIVLVKGPRQVGKTSLLARAMELARSFGSRVVSLDLQKLNSSQLTSAETFYKACIQTIIDQLELKITVEDVWESHRGANDNFERFVRREALASDEAPMLLALDEADRLFAYPFCTEVFSLFRSWHNERALNPRSPWSRLTLAIAYATEAHLIISDLNQSPFNVGTRITLQDFTLAEVGELNRTYGNPLTNGEETTQFYEFLGGCPYLVRRGLNELVSGVGGLTGLLSEAQKEDGPFRDHLHRLTLVLAQDAELTTAIKSVLGGKGCPSIESFYRLRAAGVIAGVSATECRPRCSLYQDYLSRHLA